MKDKLESSDERLQDIRRLAYESDKMTAELNNCLYEDREKLIKVKFQVLFSSTFRNFQRMKKLRII